MRLVTAFLCVNCTLGLTAGLTALAAVPQSPRVGNVEILADQGWASNPDTIWYDDFDSSEPLINRYLEASLDPVTYEALGGTGQSLRGRWQEGQTPAGNIKKAFGRSPSDYRGLGVHKNEDFTEVYWRQYVKMQEGWTGNPLKLSRAVSFSDSNWTKAMSAHIWQGASNNLAIDPWSTINSASQPGTTSRWLGNKQATSQTFDTAESGRWVSVEGRAKFNTPGQSNGVFQLWIDGQLEASSTNLNWAYDWDDYGFNMIWLTNHWNVNAGGSPAAQERYFDDFVISTAPIGLATSPLNPLVTKTFFIDPDGSDAQAAWQLQIASDLAGTDMVWDSSDILGAGLSIRVNTVNGAFQGSLTGESRLMEEHLYALRVRQQDTNGDWSGWSAWNTSLQTGLAVGPPGDFDGDQDVDGADFLN